MRMGNGLSSTGSFSRLTLRRAVHRHSNRADEPDRLIIIMGIYDRDYYRSPSGRGGFGTFDAWTVTTWLIAVNVAVFVLDLMLSHLLREWGFFSLFTAVYNYQVWRFITFQFLHENITHIFFNMLALYFFGPLVESYLGARRYLAFYLICGIGGALGYILLNSIGLLRDGPETALIGASAGIFGVLIGAAKIAPDARVMLMFPPVPMKLKTMAWVFIGIAVYTVFSNGYNAGGEAAHLGGAVVGFILIRKEGWLDFVNFRRSRMKYGGRRVAYKDWSKDLNR
jgi:membrane associated rhomboid family serine protease